MKMFQSEREREREMKGRGERGAQGEGAF